MNLKKPIALVALVAVYGVNVAPVDAQDRSTPQPRTGSAETKLVGVSLFDTGASIVAKFGSPDDIQALNVGGGGAAGGGAPGGRGGAPGGPPGAGGPGGGPPLGGAAEPEFDRSLIGDPFNDPFFQAAPGRVPGAAGGQSSRGGGPPGLGGPPGAGGPPAGGGRGAGAVGGGQNAQDVVYTRWIYEVRNSKYAFVMDKFNRVVQIEAIGLRNSQAKTRRGITFGSSFASVIKAYNAPDGYEVAGNNIVVKYLVRDRVAFRLSKLSADSPHVVTGIVVAGGKN